MTKRVYLSPSNQKGNTYSYGNTNEAVQCGRIAEACKKALERSGVLVKLGQYDTMENRCKASDAFKADMHVPIHTNAYDEKEGQAEVMGTRIFSYDTKGKGWKYANEVFKVLAPLTPGTSENVKAAPHLVEVQTPKAPTVYIEVEFHDAVAGAKWLIANTTVIGETIAKGICNALGVKFVPAQSASTGATATQKKEKSVTDVALAEVGYLEKKSNANLDSMTANAGSGNWTKYARDLDAISGWYNGKKNGYAWCAVFVDWCFVQAYGVDKAKKMTKHTTLGAGCKYAAQAYQNAGRWYTSPKVGDEIFFKSGSASYSHTGIVVAVSADTVTTVEGNTSGASGVIANGGGVCKKSYKLGSSYIVGYGRPDYSIVDAAPTASTPTTPAAKKTIDQLAQEVLAGKWGNGADRRNRLEAAGYDYEAVQAAVNAKKNPAKKETVTVELRALSKGMTGNDVRQAMLILKDRGYYKAIIPKTDNEFGPKMQNAVVAFQKAEKITANGTIDAVTWGRLLEK